MVEFIKSSTGMLLTAFVMLVLGIVLPFLMMMQILESTLLLNFFSYIISVGGLILGIVGVSLHFRREDDEEEDNIYKF